MTDNPEKRGLDRLYVNCSQPHEIDYLVEVLRQEYPSAGVNKIRMTVMDICGESTGRKLREEFMQRARYTLGVLEGHRTPPDQS